MTIANERTDEALVIADPEPVEVVLPAPVSYTHLTLPTIYSV